MENKYYFCAGGVPESNTREIYFYAERIAITESGCLVGTSIMADGSESITFALAAGHWAYLHAADCITGGYCSNIEHWGRELIESMDHE